MAELTRSATAQKMGLKNVPTSEHRANLEMTVAMLADTLRDEWDIRCGHVCWGSRAVNVWSGYRGFRLNKAVGGAATSAHCVGFALDLVPANGRLAEFKEFCREYLKGRAFDQLISEDEDERGTPRWIHVGYKNVQGGQRRQMLSKKAGQKGYTEMTK